MLRRWSIGSVLNGCANWRARRTQGSPGRCSSRCSAASVAAEPRSSLEVLAAVGLILPAALGIAPVLVPLAAVGVVLLMVGAAITHGRRHEKVIVANLAYLALAAFVAWVRFGPATF
jgi:MFS superfamily sulfate permease-like transporter